MDVFDVADEIIFVPDRVFDELGLPYSATLIVVFARGH